MASVLEDSTARARKDNTFLAPAIIKKRAKEKPKADNDVRRSQPAVDLGILYADEELMS